MKTLKTCQTCEHYHVEPITVHTQERKAPCQPYQWKTKNTESSRCGLMSGYCVNSPNRSYWTEKKEERK